LIICRSPVVKLSPSKTIVGKPVLAKVAHFSSRGPNSIAPAILKVTLLQSMTCRMFYILTELKDND
jgi:hypothetical protein